MTTPFVPRLDVLPGAQRRLWSELQAIPSDFVLYGGTAIALHVGHRQSVDFDFFAPSHFDPDTLYGSLSMLAGAQVLQKERNTLTCLVDRGGPVQLSFFGVPGLRRLSPPVVAADIGLQVASLLDLGGTKAAVVQKRAEAKDYLDLDALMQRAGLSLATMLAAGGAIYGSAFNPQITLKALCYFGDGNLGTIPEATQLRLIEAAQAVNLDALPELGS